MNGNSLKQYLENNLQEYTLESLAEKIHELNKNLTPKYKLERKNHIEYLDTYFNAEEIKGCYFLVESCYTNKDYLIDYSIYYSRCFLDYSKKSSRIHFFKKENVMKRDTFIIKLSDILITKEENEDKILSFFHDNYIGCIVINPIPNAFLGFSLLKDYNSFKKDPYRFFWGNKTYGIHFFGIKIPIETLGFHEQDSNVGACATVAVWTVFQKAAEDYYINLKSPIEITKDAGLINDDGQRMIPNSGLVAGAMCVALTKNNLETEIRDLRKVERSPRIELKRLVYAYSPLGIPIILGINVPERGDYNGHAITICGHKMAKSTYHKGSKEELNSKADYITNLYCHDDQWGPYVEISFPQINKKNIISSDFIKDKVNLEDLHLDDIESCLVDTIWSEVYVEEKKKDRIIRKYIPKKKFKNNLDIELLEGKINYSVLRTLIIPVNPKVRIPYQQIESRILEIQKVLKEELKVDEKKISIDTWKKASWDIRVRLSEDFKKEIRYYKFSIFTENEIDQKKYTILKQHLPKYIWVASLHLGDGRLMDFIFDATGLIYSNLLLHIITYIPKIEEPFIEEVKRLYNNADPCTGFKEQAFYGELVEACYIQHRENFFI